MSSEIVRVGMIMCNRYHTCAGGKCFRAMRNREGAFSIYAGKEVELVGCTTCGGCPGGNIEYAPAEMKKNGVTVIIWPRACSSATHHARGSTTSDGSSWNNMASLSSSEPTPSLRSTSRSTTHWGPGSHPCGRSSSSRRLLQRRSAWHTTRLDCEDHGVRHNGLHN